MPSKTRGRATKASKENVGVLNTKSKASVKVRGARKPLSDKTNSASDDNASVLSEKPNKLVASVPDNQVKNVYDDNVKRPRRARRLPTRYKENNALKNLTNSFELTPSKPESLAFKTPSPVLQKVKLMDSAYTTKNVASKATVLAKKKTSPIKKVQVSPHKILNAESLDCSIIKNRPKRICRLPSKFEDHSISPNKYIPLQPINASTPLATKTKMVINNNATKNVDFLKKNSPFTVHQQPILETKNKNINNGIFKNILAIQQSSPEKLVDLETKTKNKGNNEEISVTQDSSPIKLPKRAQKAKKVNYKIGNTSVNISPVLSKKRITRQKAVSNNKMQKTVADTNNNAKKKNIESPIKSPSRIFRSRTTERVINNNYSIRLLGDNKNQLKRDSGKLDVYDFTFDPDEEPPPAKKKKKKKAAAPRKTKPKTVTIRSNYDRNLAKALATLKNAVAAKCTNTENGELNKIEEVTTTSKKNMNSINNNQLKTPANEIHLSVKEQSIVNENNYNSVRVEDIARDFQIDENEYSVDYSPVNSPSRPKTPTDQDNLKVVQTPNNVDPLNLRDNSFFDDIPVASSSMNISAKHPQASPWRAEFGSLPIKWQVNTYVKSNMTPAYESSFINFNNSKKKHVYTNMIPAADDSIPQIDNTSNMKQTSIISFIKEVVERNANKKNKKATPVKANSLFEDISSTSIVTHKTPYKETPINNSAHVNITPESEQHCNNNSDMSSEKENSDDKINDNDIAPKDLNKNADKNNTYFGFDEVEDEENISPIKKNIRAKSLRSRARGILQEINDLKGPIRVAIPVAAKTKLNQNVLKRNDMKSATAPPVFPKVAIDGKKDVTNEQESCVSVNLESYESVHLFEDIDMFVHHPKPYRKSYGKAKKVAFSQKPVAGSDDSSNSDEDVVGKNASVSSDEDNLDDLSFKLPIEMPKKTIRRRKPKKQLSKKEAKEVEAWAAGFNSMCEDIDGFDLVVE